MIRTEIDTKEIHNKRRRIAVMWWNQGSGWGWGGWVGMILAMLVFWGAMIWLFVTFTGRYSKDDPDPRHAEEVLSGRFARGEIDDAEYQDRLRVLQGRPGGRAPRLDNNAQQ